MPGRVATTVWKPFSSACPRRVRGTSARWTSLGEEHGESGGVFGRVVDLELVEFRGLAPVVFDALDQQADADLQVDVLEGAGADGVVRVAVLTANGVPVFLADHGREAALRDVAQEEGFRLVHVVGEGVVVLDVEVGVGDAVDVPASGVVGGLAGGGADAVDNVVDGEFGARPRVGAMEGDALSEGELPAGSVVGHLPFFDDVVVGVVAGEGVDVDHFLIHGFDGAGGGVEGLVDHGDLVARRDYGNFQPGGDGDLGHNGRGWRWGWGRGGG